MARREKVKFCRTVALLAALVPTLYASGEIIVTGAAGDRTAFVGHLNAASTGGAWSVGEEGALIFTVGQGGQNYFVQRVREVVDAPQQIRLEVGRAMGGVLIGSYVGAGRQKLDLNDIEMLPVAHRLFPVRSASMLHEIRESFASTLAELPDFSASHRSAIPFENGDLEARGGRGFRRLDPDLLLPRNAPTFALVSWGDQDNELLQALRINFNGANDITDIRPGYLHHDEEYAGTEYDIVLESIEEVYIPAPATAAVLLFLPAIVRRRRR